jgi:3-deoxy-7-phosphoheptulonate synthase
MIIVLKRDATKADADGILADIERLGLTPLHMPGVERVVLGALGDERVLADLNLASHPAVESVKPILTPYKLVGRELHPHDSIVHIGGIPVGGRGFVTFVGHAANDAAESFASAIDTVQKNGAKILVVSRTNDRYSPYARGAQATDFAAALRLLAQNTRLPLVAEVQGIDEFEQWGSTLSGVHVSGHHMQDYALLRGLGQWRKPVILSRGSAASVEEFLMSAEAILAAGNPDVVLCESGIRTFETATRRTLDLSAVAWIKSQSHLPVVVDPIRASGRRELVVPLARAAAAAGADGVWVDVHRDPRTAHRDDRPALSPGEFSRLMGELRPFVEAAGRTL